MNAHARPVAKEPPKQPLPKALRESVRFIRRALGLVWQASPSLTIAYGVVVLLGAAIGPAIALAGKRIVDGVVAGDASTTMRWVGVELALVIGQTSIGRGGGLVRSVLGSRLGTNINVAILERAQRLELRHFEDPDFYDRLTRARREASSRPLSLVAETFSLVQALLSLAGYAVLLFRFSGLVVLVLMLATIPATIAEMKYSKAGFRMRNWRSPDARRLTYLEYILANDKHAKEMKLFGLGSLFLGRYKELAERFHDEDTVLAIRRTIVTYALALLATLAFYGAYAWMAVLAAMQKLTLGNMTMYVLAFRSGQQSFQSILGGIGSIYEHNLYMSNLFAYLDADLEKVGVALPSSEPAPSPRNGAAPVEPTERGIRLVDVSFRYPGQEKWVLRHVDLFIPARQSVAIVGQNGAGKTTLIKLLKDLGAGLETPLGKWFQDGAELSGGQWQKIALSRGFMREDADILVLDEPTAALDAEAEHAVFERFQQLTKDRTTIIISHRFPTVRMADRILVVQDGIILEDGTHASLVAAGKTYARLYELQARGYN